MSEAANVYWIPEVAMEPAKLGASIFQRGEDRKFDNTEDAIRFVMETLQASVRRTAMIQTDSASVQFEDIERMYKGLKEAPSA